MHVRGVKDACLCGGSILPPECPHRRLVTVGLARPCQNLDLALILHIVTGEMCCKNQAVWKREKKKNLSLGAARCAEFYPSTDEKEADVKVRICNSSTPPVRWKTEIAGWLKSLSTSFSQLLNGAETNKVERWTSLLKVVFWRPRHGACVQIDEACATLSCVLPLTRRLSIINAFFKPGISSWLR